MGFPLPRKPSGNIDKLLRKFAMPLDMTEIGSFEELRSYLSFYTSEAGRALITCNLYRAHRRWLVRGMKRRRAVLGVKGNVAKWQAELLVENDRTITRLTDDLERCESLVEMLDGLSRNYDKNVKALSREISARISDRDKWYGRPGEGK